MSRGFKNNLSSWHLYFALNQSLRRIKINSKSITVHGTGGVIDIKSSMISMWLIFITSVMQHILLLECGEIKLQTISTYI